MGYHSTKFVSAANTQVNSKLKDLNMVPLGASVWTTSGDLESVGIDAIAQAASGAMGHMGVPGFDPTGESITACIENSFLLAVEHGCSKLALPFIAGGIFFNRVKPAIDKAELATLIVQACINYRSGVDAVIVAYKTEDLNHFKSAMINTDHEGITLVKGSITDFSVHRCSAIANAANMEVLFGGGISGVIGDATGQSTAIDEEALKVVQAFWEANTETT